MPRHRHRHLAIGVPFVGAIAALAACSASPNDNGPSPGLLDGGFDATVGPISEGGLEDVPWDHTRMPYDGATEGSITATPVAAEVTSTRVDTQSLMFAAGEMQISGEPFAQHFAGRNLADYDRTSIQPDLYVLNFGTDAATPVKDLFGYSTAVESYEYSKMHMNMVANQTTAGISLAQGPIVKARAESTPLARLQGRANELLTAAGSDVAQYATLPPPTNNPLNYLGFSGLWPSFAPFVSFDPAMAPANQVVQSCTFAGGYGGVPTLNSLTPEFECAYNTLHLTDREKQVDKTLVPAVLGFATWKEALWSIDFSGRLHDAGSNPVSGVADADRPLVGARANKVIGTDPGAAPGTYLGSTPLEDMWGLTMIDEMDNAAELLVGSLTTTDGVALSAFARTDALAYGYDSTLRWFPSSMKVTEDLTVQPYPAFTTAIGDASSRSVDLSALLLGYAMFFGETDARNVGIGQRIGLLLTFDGDPFPKDVGPKSDGSPSGAATPHDRALAVLRVAAVDLDRMHFVAMSGGGGVLADTATVANGVATPGSTVTTTALAHALVGLRQALLSLNGAITQYGAADPDPSADQKGILNVPAIHPPSGSTTTMSARLRELIALNGAFVRDVLTKSDGTAANGAALAAGAATATTDATTLEAQSAAVRALTEAFLVTNDVTFRDRARLVAAKLLSDFYSAPARLFRGALGGADDVVMTPSMFAWLQSALRETYKVLWVADDPVLGRAALEDRIARVNKLFLNGWDDRDGDATVDKAKTECLTGRLQLGEQALTGELGLDLFGRPTTDRDNDCVLEIDGSGTGSVLASQVHFHAP
jgi:hypothetical protein